MDWSPIKRITISDEITDRLVTSIVNGHFGFGEKLPPERELASWLKVGRPTVREAIRTLSVIGLVEVRPGAGTYVVQTHADFVAKAFSWAVLLDPQTTREVVEARTAIETEIAGLAAERATQADLDRLQALIVDMEEACDRDEEAFAQADLEFHITLALTSRNTTLSRLLSAIRSLLRQWIQRALRQHHAYGSALQQHRAILLAVQAGDPAAAQEAMRHHLQEMGRLITEDIVERTDGTAPTLDRVRDAPAPRSGA
jgi:GntR family transcriptional repressor for pyruvate dehydrogenase complex